MINDCQYCIPNDPRVTSIMTYITDLAFCKVYFYHEQSYPGRLVVVCKKHVHKLTDLTPEEHASFFRDVAHCANTITELYHPDKINYLVLGDMSPHLHIHLVPKYKGGVDWGKIFQMLPEPQKYLTEEDKAAQVEMICKALEK